MKTEKNILIAFILNLSFAIFEYIGGIITGSVAIMSDAVHDIGDAASIGISYFLEKKSRKEANNNYTFGYLRYSILGGFITTLILLVGSVYVIFRSVDRLFNPIEINYSGMIIFAVIGVVVNFCAAYFTREGDSINQKAVNLHMLEDVLGWIVVLVGAILMRFTDIAFIDSIMSIGVAIFILIGTIKNIKEIGDLFLEKTPDNVNVDEVKKEIETIDGVIDVHHIHLWSMDGQNNYGTLHLVTDSPAVEMKKLVREKMKEHGIGHVTIETETSSENCDDK